MSEELPVNRYHIHNDYQSGWHKRAVCKCGWHTRAPFGDLFHIHTECCPECGNEKRSSTWKVLTMRCVNDMSRVVWYKPWTWFGSTRWEVFK